jgi:hypothetical protein
MGMFLFTGELKLKSEYTRLLRAMGSGKPRGMQDARKLRNKRREQQ